MRLNYLLIILIFFSLGCSFDKKTGIWKDAGEEKKAKENYEDRNLKPIFESKNFKFKTIKPKKNFVFTNANFIKPESWGDIYFNRYNNISNIFFENKGKYISKDIKIKSNKINPNILYYDNNLIYHDNRGNIFVQSLSTKKIEFKYNFYKKYYKKIKKKLSVVLKNNLIIVSDNLGYIYSLDISKKKLIWAVNLGKPFFSNIKIIGDEVILSDIENKIISLSVFNGKKNWDFFTDFNILKTKYQNNFAIDNDDNIIFLNSNGNIYSLNLHKKRVNWTYDFKDDLNMSSNSLFNAKPISINKNKILIVTENTISLMNNLNGNFYWKYHAKSNSKPVITNNNVFFLSNNGYLVCLSSENGSIIWSKDIVEIINSQKLQKKIGNLDNIKGIYVTHKKTVLLIFSRFILEFDIQNAQFIQQIKLPKEIFSKLIFISGELIYIGKNKKIIRVI